MIRRLRIDIHELLLYLVLAALVAAGFLFVQQRSASHADTHKEIRNLACAMVAPYPDTIEYVRNFRTTYHCHPYDPSILKEINPTGSPSVAPSRSGRVTTPTSTG